MRIYRPLVFGLVLAQRTFAPRRAAHRHRLPGEGICNLKLLSGHEHFQIGVTKVERGGWFGWRDSCPAIHSKPFNVMDAMGSRP